MCPSLAERIERLKPEKVILNKTKVYDAAYRSLARAAIPVVPEGVPFPSSGRQKLFEKAFARALDSAG